MPELTARQELTGRYAHWAEGLPLTKLGEWLSAMREWQERIDAGEEATDDEKLMVSCLLDAMEADLVRRRDETLAELEAMTSAHKIFENLAPREGD